MKRAARVPPIVVLIALGAALMLVPVPHAVIARDWPVARSFFYAAVLCGICALFLALATRGQRPRNRGRADLLTLVGAFLGLPVMLALPMAGVLPGVPFVDLWFEMVSALTTTGATLFAPAALADSVHLWRALVGWAGGLLMWVAAIAMLAPLNLGGFEVLHAAAPGRHEGTDPLRPRLTQAALRLAPVYLGLTLVVAMALSALGERPLVAACHAMAVMSTSAISPLGGLSDSAAGRAGEMVLYLFLGFAITRASFTNDVWRGLRRRRLWANPEVRLAAVVALLVPLALFAHHWFGATGQAMGQTGIQTGIQDGTIDLAAALRALWGTVFTVLSFLTTTGFVSADWQTAAVWSGMEAPGLVLLMLALVGGGVATTAGGLKLLRVHALYQHNLREFELLVSPSSVGAGGTTGREMRQKGALLAWVSFMMLVLALAGLTLLLTAGGLGFEQAVVLGVAAMANTGPVADVLLPPAQGFAALADPAKVMLALAMVLGRLETLALIALFNPAFWRG